MIGRGVAVFSLLGSSCGFAQTVPETRAASVFFQDFETVAYVRTDFMFGQGALQPTGTESMNYLKFPFADLIGGLAALGPNATNDVAKGYSALLVGAKDFGVVDQFSSGGLGIVGSRKCYIGLPKSGAQPEIEHDFRRAAKQSIGGMDVWTWSIASAGEGTRPSNLYAAQVSGSYLLVANTPEDLQQTAHALAALAEETRSVSIGVFGWRDFGTHDYWVYRLFRRTGVISQDAAGLLHLTPDVTALTFFADADKRDGFIEVLSSDKSMKNVPKVLPAATLNRLKPEGGGIWQATIPLSNGEGDPDALFWVFYTFGFGVAV